MPVDLSSNATEPALLTRDVGKSFDRTVALRSINWRVEGGEIHGLVGENGAGKSTLLKILIGQYPHGTFEGAVLVNGREVRLRRPADAAAYGIGVVPQETSVIDSLTVAENVMLPQLSALSSYRRRTALAAVHAFLERVRIPLEASVQADQLSTSEKQLLMIARALYVEPRVLLLDEPSTALTDTEVDNLYRIVRGVKEQGGSVVLVSHRLDEIIHLCDTVSVLRDGELVDRIHRTELTAERVITSMIGQDLGDVFPTRVDEPRDECALRVEGIRVRHPHFDDRWVVDDVSFSVRRGEIVGLAGHLGSGRTELLRAILGDIPSEGSVAVEGVDLHPRNPTTALAFGLQMTPEDRQKDGLFFNLDIVENLTMGVVGAFAKRGTIDVTRRRALTERLMRRVSITAPSMFSSPHELSGGNQQKVVLARSLARTPRVLMLDEPTKGIDIGAKSQVYELIAGLADQGLGVLLVSSELEELLGLCQRILVLRDGRIERIISDVAQVSRAELSTITMRADSIETA
jgi:ribose transport system ATP-binding protein